MIKRLLGIQSPTKVLERKWIGNMIVYISGPITGHKNYKKKFNSAERKLKRQGYKVVNPARLGDGIKDLSYDDILEIDLKVLGKCDAIYMLDGWESSVGAQIELKMAEKLGLNILYSANGKRNFSETGATQTIVNGNNNVQVAGRYYPGRADNMMRDGI